MPLINKIYDSLPYIDTPPTPSQLAEATALLQQDLSSTNTDTSLPHPFLPIFPDPKFSAAIEGELERLAGDEASKMVGGVDLTRYEEIDEGVLEGVLEGLENSSDVKGKGKGKAAAAKSKTRSKKAAAAISQDEGSSSSTQTHTTLLLQSHTTATHLSTRLTNLALLETYGKNAWLVSNNALENLLGDIERELKERKEEIDVVVGMREQRQRGVEGEVQGLEGVWRRGVGRVVEGEVAVGDVVGEVGRWRRGRAMVSGDGGGDRMVVDG